MDKPFDDVVYVVKAKLPKVKENVILLDGSTVNETRYISITKKGVEVLKATLKDFRAKHELAMWGREAFSTRICAEVFMHMKGISTAALDQLERILFLDTRGKSTAEILAMITELAADLPKGHALKAVPKSYPDRGAAIAAFTAVRQASLAITQKESGNMGSKKAGTEETKKPTKEETAAAAKAKKAADAAAAKAKKEADAQAAADKKAAGKTKASKDAKDTAGEAAKTKKPKADLSGKYIAAGQAAKVKSTEELGMHEASVRTKVLAVVMASKAKGGTDFAALEGAGGDQTRGAVAYLVKKGFLAKAPA